MILRTTNGSVTISAWTLHRNGSDLKKTLGDIDAEDHMTFVADNLTSYNFVNDQVWRLVKSIDRLFMDVVGHISY